MLYLVTWKFNRGIVIIFFADNYAAVVEILVTEYGDREESTPRCSTFQMSDSKCFLFNLTKIQNIRHCEWTVF